MDTSCYEFTRGHWIGYPIAGPLVGLFYQSAATKSIHALTSSEGSTLWRLMWQSRQSVKRFPIAHSDPPDAIDTMWWTSSRPAFPHSWQRQPSRSRAARLTTAHRRRGIFCHAREPLCKGHSP